MKMHLHSPLAQTRRSYGVWAKHWGRSNVPFRDARPGPRSLLFSGSLPRTTSTCLFSSFTTRCLTSESVPFTQTSVLELNISSISAAAWSWNASRGARPTSTLLCPQALSPVSSPQSLNHLPVTHPGWLIHCSPNAAMSRTPCPPGGQADAPLSLSASCLHTKPWACHADRGPAAGRPQELVRDYGDPSCRLLLPHAYSPSTRLTAKSPQRSAWSGLLFPVPLS